MIQPGLSPSTPAQVAAERQAEAAQRRCHFEGCDEKQASFGFDFGRRTFCRAHVVRGGDGRFEPMTPNDAGPA